MSHFLPPCPKTKEIDIGDSPGSTDGQVEVNANAGVSGGVQLNNGALDVNRSRSKLKYFQDLKIVVIFSFV